LSYLILALIGELQCLGTVHTLKAALPALGAAALVDMISAAYSRNMRRARDGLNNLQAKGYACYVVLALVDDINFRDLQRRRRERGALACAFLCWRAAPSCCGDTARASSAILTSHRCSLDHNTHTTSTISLVTLRHPHLWTSNSSANPHPPSSRSITSLPRHT
jgi:hypothetical protein